MRESQAVPMAYAQDELVLSICPPSHPDRGCVVLRGVLGSLRLWNAGEIPEAIGKRGTGAFRAQI